MENNCFLKENRDKRTTRYFCPKENSYIRQLWSKIKSSFLMTISEGSFLTGKLSGSGRSSDRTTFYLILLKSYTRSYYNLHKHKLSLKRIKTTTTPTYREDDVPIMNAWRPSNAVCEQFSLVSQTRLIEYHPEGFLSTVQLI